MHIKARTLFWLFGFSAMLALILLILSPWGLGSRDLFDRNLFMQTQALADQGNPEAEYYVGMMLNSGVGTKQDIPKAMAYFQKSASSGHKLAVYKLGCYYGGQFPGIIPIDNEKSFDYKLIAARAGYDLAQNDIAIIEYNQDNYEKAVQWWKYAANQAFVPSLFALSRVYEKGLGVPRNTVQAYVYLELALSRNINPISPAQQEHLNQLRAALAPSDVKEADFLIKSWNPVQTPLSEKMRKGLSHPAMDLLKSTKSGVFSSSEDKIR